MGYRFSCEFLVDCVAGDRCRNGCCCCGRLLLSLLRPAISDGTGWPPQRGAAVCTRDPSHCGIAVPPRSRKSVPRGGRASLGTSHRSGARLDRRAVCTLRQGRCCRSFTGLRRLALQANADLAHDSASRVARDPSAKAKPTGSDAQHRCYKKPLSVSHRLPFLRMEFQQFTYLRQRHLQPQGGDRAPLLQHGTTCR